MVSFQARQVSLLILSRALRSASAGLINVAFPYLILKYLQGSVTTLSLSYVLGTVSTAVLGLVLGFSADLYGRRRVLIISSVLLPLSSVLLFLYPSPATALASSFIGGYSAVGSLSGGGVGGMVAPVQSAVLADIAPPEVRTKYFSLFTFLSGVAGALGSLGLDVVDARYSFLVAGVLSLASLFLLFPLRIQEHRRERLSMRSKGVVGRFTLTGLLNGFSQGIITPFLVPFFIILYDVPRAQMGTYSFFAGMIGAVSLLSAPFRDRRLGFVKSISFTRGVGAILALLLPLVRYFPFSLGVYLLLPALRIAALPAQTSAMTRLVDREEVGSTMGINQVARLSSSAGGTAVGGVMFSENELPVPFFLYSLVVLANVFLYIKFFGLDSKKVGALGRE